MKFAAKDKDTCVRSYQSHGPFWGNTSSSAFGIMNNTHYTKKTGENFFTCNVFIDFSSGFDNNGQDNKALHGRDNRLINIEVYTVEG